MTRSTRARQRPGIDEAPFLAEVGFLGRMADREGWEEARLVADRGMHEIQARFESAFTSAPIGMALIDMDARRNNRCSSMVSVVGERCGTSASWPHRFPWWGRKSRAGEGGRP